MTEAYLGVDIGTSSSKGVLVAQDGEILAVATRAHSVSRPQIGHVEMDGELWWDEFVAIATEITSQRPTDIRAIGVSGMGPCVLLTDEAGTPLRPAILYGVDTRATAQIQRLTSLLGGDADILRRTGSVLSAQAAGPKLTWVRENEPEVWARSRHLFMPASWLVYRLTGEVVLDHHSASQCTPMYDPGALAWDAEWAPLVAPGLDLPRLCWPGDVAGTTRAALAGIPAGTPVVAGTIDAWAEAISVGATNPGDLMIMYGTTMFLVATTETEVTSPTMWATVGAFPDTHSLAGGLATSGALTTWLRDLTGADYAELLAEAATSPRGARGLLALPYFAGERTPVLDPHARGVLAGLSLEHGRGDLSRAILEATAFGVRHNIEEMVAAGASIERVIAVGGGTRGELWTTIVSEVTGLPQVIPTTAIGASLGAAFLAAGAVGRPSIDDWNPPSHLVRPDSAAREDYDELFALYRDLYPATREISHALAARQATARSKEMTR